jgi:hypothetical protein
MSISAYDIWKTTAPVYRRAQGDCLECGCETQWITGRALAERQAADDLAPVPGKLFDGSVTRIDPDELYCAYCGSEAVRAKFDPCTCGAETAWRCVCP